MAKNKGETQPKRYGTLIRVSFDFAEKIKAAAAVSGISIADFAATHLSEVVDGVYREKILTEAKRLN